MNVKYREQTGIDQVLLIKHCVRERQHSVSEVSHLIIGHWLPVKTTQEHIQEANGGQTTDKEISVDDEVASGFPAFHLYCEHYTLTLTNQKRHEKLFLMEYFFVNLGLHLGATGSLELKLPDFNSRKNYLIALNTGQLCQLTISVGMSCKYNMMTIRY